MRNRSDRFLSADPFVQDSTNLQALNRYSYVQNNPLSYTDPSGYFLKKLIKKIGRAIGKAHEAVFDAFISVHKKFFRAIAKVEGFSTAMSIGLGVACNAFAAQCVMAFNAAMTAANGGTISQVITGAAVGYIAGEFSTQLGVAFNAGDLGNVGAAMIVGGGVAKAQGGKFIDGVKGAAAGAAISIGIQRIMNPSPELPSSGDIKPPNGSEGEETFSKAKEEAIRQKIVGAKKAEYVDEYRVGYEKAGNLIDYPVDSYSAGVSAIERSGGNLGWVKGITVGDSVTIYRAATHATSGSVSGTMGFNFKYTNFESALSTVVHESYHYRRPYAPNNGHPAANRAGNNAVKAWKESVK